MSDTFTKSAKQERGLSSKDRLPPNSDYIIRLVGNELGNSKSSNNPMFTEEWELVSPDSVNINGDDVTIAGTKGLNQYFVIKVTDEEGKVDEDKTQKARQRYVNHLEVCGMELPEEIDFDDPPRLKIGTQVYARLTSAEYTARKDQTPEQKARGEEGEIMKNPLTGKPLISYRTAIVEIFGPADVDVNKPY